MQFLYVDLQSSRNAGEFEKLKKDLETEKLKKEQAVNKLAEIMNRKEFNKGGKSGRDRASASDLKKKEKDLRRAQQELTMVRFIDRFTLLKIQIMLLVF